ncbi:GNAT family N-acetyltransferase [Paenibacillus senegalensis]|uniref:GNAT family N-acetyltransferase n=1 Tax=Paenibacillus senegalensis TaxID=1465766 RepID=UPI000287D17D|nr:N-acetyltransferase [Paenibacillus senegalensis]
MITVSRADKLGPNAREQMAKIFAEGFKDWLVFFSKDENQLAAAFGHMFVLNQFYAAVIDNEIAAIAACTNCQTPSVKLQPKELRKHLGWFKGSLAAFVLKKEFEAHFKNPPSDTGSIEFVGTAAQFRGQGVASEMIRYIMESTPYKEYLIEEVADTNIPAMNLYKKLGFQEYRRTPVPQMKAKKIGITNFIALKYRKEG